TPSVGTVEQQAAFERGTTMQRDGDYAGAAAVFGDLASASAPNVAFEARLRLGQSLIAARRPGDALAPLGAADAAQPGSPATFLLGRALAARGRCREAIPDFEAYLAANPGPLGAQAKVAEASCLADLGRPSDGVPLLEQAAATTDLARLQTLDF